MNGHTPTLSPRGAVDGPFNLPTVLMVRLRTELMLERAERQQRHRRRLGTRGTRSRDDGQQEP